jgi:hypothetical protein
VFIGVWLSQRVRVVDKIDRVEVDDIISYHDVVTAENWGAHAPRVLVSAPRRNEL